MRNNRIKNCAFFLISCFCLNFGFAQKSKPNKNTKPAPVKPEAGTIKTNFIRFNCNQTLFDVPVDKQKIIIPEGQFYAKLKLLSPIKPGEADFGLEYAVLEPFKDTIFIRSIPCKISCQQEKTGIHSRKRKNLPNQQRTNIQSGLISFS